MGKNEGFIRSVFILVSGSAAAQAIVALAMPFLTRIYGPSDFGVLAVYTGIVTTCGVVACLRYDIALGLPASDDEALLVLVLAFGCAAVFCLIAYFAIYLAYDLCAAYFNIKYRDQVKWLIPVGIILFSLNSILQNWSIRKKSFKKIAKAKFGQALTTAGIQIYAGIVIGGSVGIVFGYVAGFFVSVLVFCNKKLFFAVKDIAHLEIKNVAIKYIKFPLYSTWEALLNQAAISFPVMYIANAVASAEAGSLMMATYVLQVPMSLLGASIGQVYFSQAYYHYSNKNIGNYTIDVLVKLIKIGFFPIVFMGIVSPTLFSLIFGDEWERAGKLVAWMTPWFFMQFIVSPISMVLHVVGAQRIAMLLQLVSFLIRMISTWMFVAFGYGYASEAYAVSGFVVYAVYFCTVMYVVSKLNENIEYGKLIKLGKTLK